MAFLLKYFGCCQSSKNVEAEKEFQELRLSSPRFPLVGVNAPTNNQNIAAAPLNHLNDNYQNDQTFQADDSVNVDNEHDNQENNQKNNYIQVSFDNLKDCNTEHVSKDIQEESFEDRAQGSFGQIGIGNKKSEKETVNDNKGLKKTKTLKKNDVNNLEDKTSFGGFIVMNKINREEEDLTNKDNWQPYRRDKTREMLNSSPRMLPANRKK